LIRELSKAHPIQPALRYTVRVLGEANIVSGPAAPISA
jgi:hypothetical protein